MTDYAGLLGGIGQALTGFSMGAQGRGAEFAQGLQAQQRQQQEDARRKQIESLQGRAIASSVTLNALKAGNTNSAFEFLGNVISDLKQQGGSEQDINDALSLASLVRTDPKKAIETLSPMVEAFRLKGLLPKSEEDELSKGVQSSEILPDGTVITVLKNNKTTVTDPEGNLLTGKARFDAIKKARQYGAKEQEIRSEGREVGKLTAQLKLTPEIKGAVEEAVSAAKQVAKTAEEEKSNEKAFAVYEAAKNGLISSLSKTTTGPIAGWLPAITSSQQIADGAIAAMAPTMKEMFRSAGEGTFTDSDQKILMDMIPTRGDSKETIKAKMENIDTIINARLGRKQSPVVGTPQENIQKKPVSGIKLLGIE